MDKFVTITKPAGSVNQSVNGDRAGRNPFKYSPYPIPKSKERQVEAWRDRRRTEKILQPLQEGKKPEPSSGSKTLARHRHVLATLKDGSNPITHSTAGQRAEHVDSCVTGHQRSDGRRSGIYVKSRSKKLEEQSIQKGSGLSNLLSGVKVHVGGYMAGTTDIEIKRIVTLHGGRIMNTASGATHILTSQGLSTLKTHKYLHGSARSKAHVVTPQWIMDSISAGKKKYEGDYSVVKDTNQCTLSELGIQRGCVQGTGIGQ